MPFLEKGLVVCHRQVTSSMYEIEMIAPAISKECEPGKFVHVRPGITSDPLLRRPLSIYDVDRKLGSVTLLYKVVGRGTDMLTKVRPKEYVDLMGPHGRGFYIPEAPVRCLLVGGGVGIAPLVYLARVLVEKKCPVKVLYGTASRLDLAGFNRFREMGVEFMPATMDGSAGYRGVVSDLLCEKITPGEVDFIYTCGPEMMMAAVAGFARKHNIPGEVSLEETMACGVGACLGCARKLKANDREYAKVCKDGPVFAMDEVEFEHI